jgi:hypothetical protein
VFGFLEAVVFIEDSRRLKSDCIVAETRMFVLVAIAVAVAVDLK